MGNQDTTPTALWNLRNVGPMYQNTEHGTQDHVPNVLHRTAYQMYYVGTLGPGLQSGGQEHFPLPTWGKEELKAGVMCATQCKQDNT